MVDSAYSRRVYVLCRPIFSDNNAQVRNLKNVKELVNNSRKSMQLLQRDIGEAKLVEILRYMLKSRNFEPKLRAKVEFPDFFRPLPFVMSGARRPRSMRSALPRRPWMRSRPRMVRDWAWRIWRAMCLRRS
ncbi:hypothetical protein K469DRAFT_285515 [Zopfia rhizophila CBS 207.26]|uniref:Uncharacterized protein n=1 Tax=Zopfia rhizophila CBS 207.26 TaxID=1314779 RepID=A0A6A6ENL4_9PEZI|nr:hypothetical protein K469DRAFT_285515 [Zopfia rhizophila CBS 207.26]